MSEITAIGKRKFIVAIAYPAAVFLVCGWLVYVDKITGSEFIKALEAAGLLVAVFLGANVAKGIWGK